MSHLDDVVSRVDAVIAENIIVAMNELLIELSDDTQLSREDRYQQQQRLRTAIAHKGHHQAQERQQAESARLEQLTRGGTIV